MRRKLLQRPLRDRLHVLLLHGRANLPMHDRPAIAVQERAQIVKGAADVEVGNIHVPVLVRLQRLHKTRAFLGLRPAPPIEPPGRLEHAVHARRADRRHVVVEHHVRQAAIAFPRMAIVIVDDRLFLFLRQPAVARRVAVVFVRPAVPLAPLVILARRKAEPAEQHSGRQLRAVGPMPHVVDDLVARVVGNPTSFQSSPLAFFERTFSSISSEMTSFF